MRKSAIMLLLFVVITLSACKPVEEEYISYTNEADNTKQELIQLIGQVLLKTELLLPVEKTPNIIEVEYPFYKSNFTFINSTNTIDQVSFSSGVVLHISLTSIRNDLSSSTSYEEDAWKEVYNSNEEKVYQYRIFMNEEHIVLQHYKKDEQNIITGYHASISIEDNKLEFIMNSIDYNYDNDLYENGQQSYFKEDEIYYEKSLLSKSDQHLEKRYMEYGFSEDNYKNIYFKNMDYASDVKEVEFFNSNDNYHVKYIDQSSNSPTIEIAHYDSIGERIFKTKKEQGYFTFEFNLKYVHGWDKILNLHSLNDLYTYSNEYRELPEDVYTIIRPEEGIYISGNLLKNSLTLKFNLGGPDLTGPIEYNRFLLLEDELKSRADDLLFNTLENDLFEIEDLYDDILHYLYEEEFYGMCKDLIK